MEKEKTHWIWQPLIAILFIVLFLILIFYIIPQLMHEELKQNQTGLEVFIGNITNFYHIFFDCDENVGEWIIGFDYENNTIKLNGTELCEVVNNQFEQFPIEELKAKIGKNK